MKYRCLPTKDGKINEKEAGDGLFLVAKVACDKQSTRKTFWQSRPTGRLQKHERATNKMRKNL